MCTKQKQKQKRNSIIEQIFRECSLHKQLFSVQEGSNRKRVIKFIWTPAQFVAVVQNVILKSILQPQTIDDVTTKVLYEKGETLGSILESWLCVLLNIPNTVSIYQYDYNSPRTFNTYDSDSFIQFNKLSSTIPLNFFKMIQKAKKNPNKFIFGHPIRYQKNQNAQIIQIHGSKSKCIDYAFIQYNEKQKKIKIYTFDITVTSDKELIEGRLGRAKKLLTKDVSIPDQYYWHHTILCSSNIAPKHLTSGQKIPLKWEIQTSNLDLFQVFNTNLEIKFQHNFRSWIAYRNIFLNYAAKKRKK